MKRVLTAFLIFNLFTPVFAGSINPAVYRTVQRQAYRANYRNQTNYNTIPYWQAQANYTTRNRLYGDYRSYNNYSNYMRQYNSQFSRGRY